MQPGCSTRPDIHYAVNQLAAYMSKPTKTHLQAAKHILRYLRGQEELGLTYKYSSTNPETNGILITYSDSSWGGDVTDARSTTGTVCIINGAAIILSVEKQQTTH